MSRIGIILLVFGIIYIVKPDLYRRWIWKKTDVLQQVLSPKRYIKFMRVLGVILSVAGIILLILGKFKI